MTIQYLLDEHMPLSYRTQMLSRAPSLTIWKIGMPGVPPSGTLDPEILLWCEANDFILVTNNRKSMPVHLADHLAAGRHVPSILTVDITRDMAGNLDDLLLTPSLTSIKTPSYTCRSNTWPTAHNQRTILGGPPAERLLIILRVRVKRG